MTVVVAIYQVDEQDHDLLSGWDSMGDSGSRGHENIISFPIAIPLC